MRGGDPVFKRNLRRTHPSYEKLAALAESDLEATEAMQINAHLVECEECRGEVDVLMGVVDCIRDLGLPPLGGSGVLGEIFGAGEAERTDRSPRGWLSEWWQMVSFERFLPLRRWLTRPHPSYERLSDLVDGTLDPSKAMEINAHMVKCRVCREEVDFITDLRGRLGILGVTLTGPRELPSLPETIDDLGAREGPKLVQ